MEVFIESRSRSWRSLAWISLILLCVAYAVPLTRGYIEGVVGSGLGSVNRFIDGWRRERLDEQERALQEARARVALFAVSEAKMAALQEENDILRKQGNYRPDSGFSVVGAQVVSRVMMPDQATLVINRGAEDGIEEGQAVLADDGMFIGKVRSLGKRTARVQLMTDPQSRVAATLAGERRLLGVVEGRGNGAARMTYVPASQPMKKDQIIVTSGTEEKIPANLPLGLINAVEGKSTDPFISAILEPLVPFDRLTLVQVLRPQESLRAE
jgi:rod shape-determining protein MreC